MERCCHRAYVPLWGLLKLGQHMKLKHAEEQSEVSGLAHQRDAAMRVTLCHCVCVGFPKADKGKGIRTTSMFII